jgi:hypothetical protein
MGIERDRISLAGMDKKKVVEKKEKQEINLPFCLKLHCEKYRKRNREKLQLDDESEKTSNDMGHCV